MAAEGLEWPNRIQGRDYHLMPGYVSPRFDQILWIKYSGNVYRRADRPEANASVSFSASSTLPGVMTLPGVTVDRRTGQVEIASPLPAAAPGQPWPQMISILCEVMEGATVMDRRSVRVWVHEKLEEVWLTPFELTIRQGAKRVRFSLMAKFTDGVVADISNWSPMVPTALDDTYVQVRVPDVLVGTVLRPAVRWSDSGGGVLVNPLVGADTTGFLACTSASASSTISAHFISAQFNAAPSTIVRTAVAKGAASWSTRSELKPVTTAFTFGTMKDRRNVIILPDGFHDDTGQAEFEALARKAVDRLARQSLTRPYDLLKDRFNFFMTWVPSRDSDITVSADLVRQTYSGPPGPFPQTRHDAVLYDGKMSGPHFLLNERDTAFHSALGERPAAEEDNPNYPLPHPLRLHPDDFDQFLRNLSSKPLDPSHMPEGSVWARRLNDQPEDRYLKGKDEALCVILCRTPHEGGVNTFRGDTARTVLLPVENRKVLYAATNALGGDDLVVAALDRDKTALAVWLTMAHELGHSFGLTDEYGGSGENVTRTASEVINESANTQLLTSFVNSQLSREIKWNWPRVLKAAIYTDFKPDGSQFVCTLHADYKKVTDVRDHFAPGNIVRLRTRDLLGKPNWANNTAYGIGQLIRDNNVPNGGFECLVNHTSPVWPTTFAQDRDNNPGRWKLAEQFSSDMEVVSAPPKSLNIKLKSATPPSAPFLPFRSEGLLVESPRGEIFGGAIDYLRVVHHRVSKRISDTENPLNAMPGDQVGRRCITGSGIGTVKATNFDVGKTPKPPTNSSWIIGLYESGKGYNCSVYHPSGVCVMNETLSKDPRLGEKVNEFCHVCRYAMVDLLDPLKHGAIDRDYAPRYPKNE